MYVRVYSAAEVHAVVRGELEALRQAHAARIAELEQQQQAQQQIAQQHMQHTHSAKQQLVQR